MALTETATRMMRTLPSYYDGNAIVERIIQAKANEIDRIDARIDQLKNGVVPGLATDELGLLAAWERILRLPVSPVGASVGQRQAAVKAQLGRLNAVTAADVIGILLAAVGPIFSIARNTPGPLQDTITIPYDPGSFGASQVERIARTAWPAHRQVFIAYGDGFILDVALLDLDTL